MKSTERNKVGKQFFPWISIRLCVQYIVFVVAAVYFSPDLWIQTNSDDL